MLAPQSDSEVRPVVDALQRMDALLDVRWNPEAVMLAKGSYSELGKLIPPTYDGRWQIIRYDSANTGHAGVHEGRGYTVICTITEPTIDDHGVIAMAALREGGAYAPLGEWVVTMMQQADAANVRQFEAIRRHLWAENDRAEDARDRLDEAAAIEALDHNHFQANYAGGVGNWQGKGADFHALAAREARATQGAVRRILTSTT